MFAGPGARRAVNTGASLRKPRVPGDLPQVVQPARLPLPLEARGLQRLEPARQRPVHQEPPALARGDPHALRDNAFKTQVSPLVFPCESNRFLPYVLPLELLVSNPLELDILDAEHGERALAKVSLAQLVRARRPAIH